MLYLHVPTAVMTLVAFTLSAAAGAVVLWRRSEEADRWARAAMGAGLIMGTVMLASGMIWARMAWSHWWDFKSPKLMLSLVLWILMAAYFILRGSLPEGPRRTRIAAVYGLIALLDVPLVYLSSRLAAGDIHPATTSELIDKPSGLGIALGAAFLAAATLTALLVAALLAQARRRDSRDEH
jgi:heme exporter protein C